MCACPVPDIACTCKQLAFTRSFPNGSFCAAPWPQRWQLAFTRSLPPAASAQPRGRGARGASCNVAGGARRKCGLHAADARVPLTLDAPGPVGLLAHLRALQRVAAGTAAGGLV
eukprot:355138-Chlamydomonas_euryale.AAC.1